MFIAPFAMAEQYKVLVIPDNIVTDNEAVDSYIYNATSEFFANEVINLLNQTDYIKSPTVSEERKLLKSNPSYMIPARNLTNRFKTSYNVDYTQLKKISNQAKYVLLITSSIDSENYIYKTISVVENRIITRGPSPQTEQLQKIRDYSRMLCPEIAQNVQERVLPPATYAKESNQIYYDMGNFDNVFTKKYRRWHKEGGKDYAVAKSRVDAKIADTKDKINDTKEKTKSKYKQFKEDREQKAKEKALQKQLEVKAEPVKPVENGIQNINYKKPTLQDESLYQPINLKKTRKNNLYGDFDPSRPPLRDYN